MGNTKTSSDQTQSQTQTSTMTPAESEYQQLLLNQYKTLQPQQTQSAQSGYNLINSLLTGGNLPGYLNQLTSGISSSDVATASTQYALNAMPSFQALGLTDSGVVPASIAKGIANEIVLPVAQSNQNTLLNLLNLASGQAANTTGTTGTVSNTLANQLAGLRSTTTTGTSGTTSSTNPFLQSFYQGIGSVPGNIMSRFGQGTGMFGGGSI